MGEPAPIENMAIEVKGADIRQTRLVILSGLPNSCYSFGGYNVSRSGETIHVKVFNLVSDDPSLDCREVYRTVATEVPLEEGIEICGIYAIDINGHTHTIQATAPNVNCDHTLSTSGIDVLVGMGERVEVGEDGLLLTLLELLADSRCSGDSLCTQADQATVLVKAEKDGTELGTISISLTEGAETIPEVLAGYAFWLNRLDSHPNSPKSIEGMEPPDHVAHISVARTAQNGILSGITWETATPESQGMDGSKLDFLYNELESRNTRAFLVVRNGYIVYERYAPNNGRNTIFHAASLTQSLSGSLALMLAVDTGRIQLDDPAWKYIPQWKNDPLRSGITIRHLVSESSGLENVSFLHADELTGWKRNFYENSGQRHTISISEAPVIFPAGTKTRHSGPGQHALDYALAASLKGAPEQDLYLLLRRQIMEPIGIPGDHWKFSYGRSNRVDDLKVYTTGSGSGYTARAMARIGQFFLNRGNWNNKQLLDPNLIDAVASYANTPIPERVPGNPEPATGLGWRVNFDGVWHSLPRDAYAGAGHGDNVVLIIPSQNLVVVRAGGELGSPRQPDSLAAWGPIDQFLFDPIMEAIMSP
jgi:CubicO group peptidase (beta-lactamase class C family)